MLSAPASADASCCDMPCCAQQKDMACCEQPKAMPCCEQQKAMPCCEQPQDMSCCGATQDQDAIEMLMALNTQVEPADPQLAPAPPARQVTEVWFQRPVIVGKSILQGRYVIEHDNDRMARGEPCTYIYAFDDRTKPVVTFHCTHLERERATQNIAVVETKGDLQVLKEFQFAGETASHGVPSTIR
jgi:hypothetical protein